MGTQKAGRMKFLTQSWQNLTWMVWSVACKTSLIHIFTDAEKKMKLEIWYPEVEVCTGHTLADFLAAGPWKFDKFPLQSGPILQVLVHKNGFTELAYLKSDSQRNVPPSSVNIFPSIGAKQSLWHGLPQQHWTTFNNLQIKQPRWSSLPPTFSQL